MKQLTILIILLVLNTACVSLELSGKRKREKSNQISFIAPNNDFTELENPIADRAWQSKNGNTISFYSECSPSKSSLLSIRSSLISNMQSPKIISERFFEFNKREALRSLIHGKMEGIPVFIDLVIFRKNMCSYNISYISLKENYKENVTEFNQFLKEVKVRD